MNRLKGDLAGGLIIAWLGFSPLLVCQGQSLPTKNLQNPEFWKFDKGDRMQEPLPYLVDPAPDTRIHPPLKSRIRNDVFIVGDDVRGDLLRLERVKDYIRVEAQVVAGPSSRGRIIVGGPHLSHRNVTLFHGEQRLFGEYLLYEEIRVFSDPNHDFFPAVVIRFWGADQGVVYLDPMGAGEPQAVVNFSSVPDRRE